MSSGSSPEGVTPSGDYIYDGAGGFAAYAATTETQWTALITNELTASYTPAETGFWDLLFNIDAAQSSADYANAQLSIMNRTIKDLFDQAEGTALSANWDTDTEGAGLGTIEQDGKGNADWVEAGGVDRGELNRWNAEQTATNSQLIQIISAIPPVQELFNPNSKQRIYGHMNDTSTIADYVYAEIGATGVEIGMVIAGVETVLGTNLSVTMRRGDVWDFTCGTPASDYSFILYQNGTSVLTATDGSALHSIGAGYRSVGFGMFAVYQIILISQSSPGEIAVFSADDATWGS